MLDNPRPPHAQSFERNRWKKRPQECLASWSVRQRGATLSDQLDRANCRSGTTSGTDPRAFLRAATELFLTGGYTETSVKDICNRAGHGYNAFVAHFDSKQQIGHQVAESWPTAAPSEFSTRAHATPTT